MFNSKGLLSTRTIHRNSPSELAKLIQLNEKLAWLLNLPRGRNCHRLAAGSISEKLQRIAIVQIRRIGKSAFRLGIKAVPELPFSRCTQLRGESQKVGFRVATFSNI